MPTPTTPIDMSPDPKLDEAIVGKTLRNPEHEAYAINRVFHSKSMQQAYRAARGLLPSSQTPTARKWEEMPEIRARMRSLKLQRERMEMEANIVSRTQLSSHLLEIVENGMGISRVVTGNGLEMRAVHRDDLTGEEKLVGVFKRDYPAAKGAIDTLLKMNGWDKPIATKGDPIDSADLDSLTGMLERLASEVKDLQELKKVKPVGGEQ